ncbi:MAG: hypothetical protein KDE27_11420, partial [Planctomycetes bacterium]|nr:hypothetical protein [Planctomycetota bacterium]
MHTLPIAVSLLAAATLAPATLAQVDSTAIRPTAIAAGTCVPIHSAAPDLGLEYGVWAAGDDYKVSFHGDMTFVPYLGAAYPHNQPWSWRTASVRCGEVELAE